MEKKWILRKIRVQNRKKIDTSLKNVSGARWKKNTE
jgi:hypothetical protein|tara:strand:- start:3896 stop:4003 length:108 start_codon:yes stop_codon:yes gene_type:complete